MPTNYSSYYEQYMAKLQRAAENAVREALKNTYQPLFKYTGDRMQELFQNVIEDFYNSYTPKYYGRNESLYNLLHVEVGGDGDYISVGFEPEKMTPMRHGGTGLYDQVFKKGWHGGADSGEGHPSPDTPYWRTPFPDFSNWCENPAAIAAISPLDDFKRVIKEYESGEMVAEFNRLWEINKRKIKIVL